MAPFGGDWNEDPKEFLDWFFQCMGTAGDEFKAKQFIYYLQADSYADEWYEEIPQQEQQNWVSVEALFRKRWLKEEVISIKETITIENEHQPAPTTSHIITLDPLHDSEADSQDISEGDDERNERNVSHDVTTTSPTATTTLFDQKPLPSPESTHKLCLDTTQQHLVAPSTLLITPRQPQNTSQAVATSLSTPVPFRAPCHQKPSESAETFRKLLQEPSEGIQDTSRRTGYPNFEKKLTDFTQSPSYPPDEPISPEPPPNTSETQPPPSANPTKPKTPIAARIFTQTVKICNVGLPTPYTPSDKPISPQPPPNTSKTHPPPSATPTKPKTPIADHI